MLNFLLPWRRKVQAVLFPNLVEIPYGKELPKGMSHARYSQLVQPDPKIPRLTGEALANHTCPDGDDDTLWMLIPGRGSASSGEARFECRQCGKRWFRGGIGSEWWYELQPKHFDKT